MKRSEEERRLLEEARLRAEHARYEAEQAASMEKEEREKRVRNLSHNFVCSVRFAMVVHHYMS